MRIANLVHRQDSRRTLALVDTAGSLFAIPDVAEAVGAGLPPDLTDPFGYRWLDPEGLVRLAELEERICDAGIAPNDPAEWRFGPPVPRPGKIIAAGRNYMDHVREGQEIWAKRGRKVEIPQFPTAFAKFASSLTGPYDPLRIPDGIDDLDYEVELAVVIGTPALNVTAERALEHVAGYAVCNDAGALGIQRREMEAQIGIVLAKNFPGFAPMGPWLTTADAVRDPQALRLTLEVDGEVRQDANTADMMFPVTELIAWWSRTGLETGDILITGTPSGVALAREDPAQYYLRPGQTVVARIERLGELRNRVV